MGKATQPTTALRGTDADCHCIGIEPEWHNELAEIFSAEPEYIKWGYRLVSAAHEADTDRDLTRLAGSHVWPSGQIEVYELAAALEDLAENATKGLQARRTS